MTRRPRYLAALVTTLLLASAIVASAAPAEVDDPPTLTISDATAVPDTNEGNSGAKSFTFDVTLTGTVTEDVKVTARTFAGSAVVVSDFTDTLTQLTFTEAGTQQVAVPVHGDEVQEADEEFIVRISTATGGVTIADDTGVAVILNDDGPMVKVAGPSSATTEPSPEGNPRNARFTVTATDRGGSTQFDTDAVVSYRTVAGTATAGQDYQHGEGTVTLAPPGAGTTTTVHIDVPVLGDSVYEGADPEAFTLELHGLANAVWELGGEGAPLDTADGLIAEGSDPPALSIADADVREGDGGDAPTALVTVALSRISTQPVSFTYSTRDGNGSSPARVATGDYTPIAPGTAGVVPPLAKATTIEVGVVGDDTHEDNEVFHVDLALAEGEAGATLAAADALSDVTIRNDEGVFLSIDDVSAYEGADGTTTLFTFTLALSEAVDTDVKVSYQTSDGNTFAGVDYEPVAGDLTIPAGQTSATVPVIVKGDDFAGPDEDFYLDLTATTPGFPGPTILRARGKGTIRNDDGPRITIAGISAVEGNPGAAVSEDTTDFEITVTLSAPFTHPDFVTDVSVDFETRHITTADDDLDAVSGTLVIPEGETEGTITVPVAADDDPEPTEDFEVVLSGAFNGYIVDGTGVATGTIVNDDGPTISVEDIAVPEGDSGATQAVFALELSEASDDVVSVEYRTVDGIAKASSQDYTSKSGKVSFAPGATTRQIVVAVRGDEAFEPDESFSLALSRPAYGALAKQAVTATVVNDDANRPPDIVITAPETVESWEPVRLRARAEDPDGHDIAGYAWRLGDGQTADGPVLTHTFTRSGTYEIHLTVADELGAKATESITVTVTDSGEVTRAAGANRIATAVAVSRDHWDEAETAVLATAWDYPDALAGGALAASLGVPLLLTDKETLPEDVLAEIDRLGVSDVWLLGGPAAVSPAVEDAVVAAGHDVMRIAGADRFATAAAVAAEVGTESGEAVLALGIHEVAERAWPDALAAGALASSPDRVPTLMTRSDGLPEATRDALASLGVETVYLVGGPVAIDDAVAALLGDLGYEVVRLAGDTRYGTSVAVAAEALARHGARSVPAIFATGLMFPDGLAAAALAGRLGGLVVLVPPSGQDDTVAGWLDANAERIDLGVIVGGPAAVSDDVTRWLAELIAAG